MSESKKHKGKYSKKKSLQLPQLRVILLGAGALIILGVVIALILSLRSCGASQSKKPDDTTGQDSAVVGTEPVSTDPAVTDPAGTTPYTGNPNIADWPNLPIDKIPQPEKQPDGEQEETENPDSGKQENPEKDPPAADHPSQPPQVLPPSVEIPPSKDPTTGETVGITFPCNLPDYGLVLEKLAPYDGLFVEDGSNDTVDDVAMVMIHNYGDFPLDYAQLKVEYEGETLEFDITALPKGQRLVVQEKSRKSIPQTQPLSATALVVQGADMDMNGEKLSVKDNGDNTLTITNLTQETITTARLFYKYYLADSQIYVGGIAFTVKLTQLAPGSSVTLQPNHYNSQTSQILMVQVYD